MSPEEKASFDKLAYHISINQETRILTEKYQSKLVKTLLSEPNPKLKFSQKRLRLWIAVYRDRNFADRMAAASSEYFCSFKCKLKDSP